MNLVYGKNLRNEPVGICRQIATGEGLLKNR